MTPSLWEIESSVAQLIAMLDEPDITEEERAVALSELERYVTAEVKKVDAIRAIIRHCDRDEAEALAAVKDASLEVERQRARASVFANRRDRIKAMALAAMTAMGLRKIEGKTGRLRIQVNGGKQKLNISNEMLVPDEYRVFSFRLPAPLWQAAQRILAAHTLFGDIILRGMLASVSQCIDEAKVRSALEARCQVCHGEMPECAECNGTGHQLVPGAELEARGEHLRVE